MPKQAVALLRTGLRQLLPRAGFVARGLKVRAGWARGGEVTAASIDRATAVRELPLSVPRGHFPRDGD